MFTHPDGICRERRADAGEEPDDGRAAGCCRRCDRQSHRHSRMASTNSAGCSASYIQDEWKVTEQADAEHRRSLRPDGAVRRQEPGQPALQPGLQARSGGRSSTRAMRATSRRRRRCWGRSIRHSTSTTRRITSAVGNFGPILPERSTVVDAGITQQLLPPCPSGTGGLFSKTPVAGDQLSGVGGWRRRLLQARDRSSGRRSVRTGLRSHGIQLRQGRELGNRGES